MRTYAATIRDPRSGEYLSYDIEVREDKCKGCGHVTKEHEWKRAARPHGNSLTETIALLESLLDNMERPKRGSAP